MPTSRITVSYIFPNRMRTHLMSALFIVHHLMFFSPFLSHSPPPPPPPPPPTPLSLLCIYLQRLSFVNLHKSSILPHSFATYSNSPQGVSVEAVDPVFQTKMLDMLKQTGRFVHKCEWNLDNHLCELFFPPFLSLPANRPPRPYPSKPRNGCRLVPLSSWLWVLAFWRRCEYPASECMSICMR